MSAKDLVILCKERNLTVSSCESLTAGLFTSEIASVPGASSVLKGGLVTYFTQMKQVLANVDACLIQEFGVVSKECAQAMAKNTRLITDSDYCVSFTGNAGPDVMEDKPAGCVYCAIASKNKVYSYHFQFDGLKRNEIRKSVVDCMIANLVELIDKE